MTELLITNNADVNVKDENGAVPLLWTSQFGTPKITKLLIESGAELDITNKSNDTALFFSVEYGMG